MNFKSTERETQAVGSNINFLFMGKTISAKPLFERLIGRGAKASFAKQLQISEGRLSNWQARGIPPAMIPAVSAALHLSIDDYYRLAGSPADQQIKKQARQFIPNGNGEQIIALLKTFLDTDDDTRDEILAAVSALTGDNHGAAERPNHRRKPKR